MSSWQIHCFVVVTLYGGNLYLWGRVASVLGLDPTWKLAALALAAVIGAATLALEILRRRAPLLHRHARWAVAALVGLFGYLLPLLALGQVFELTGRMLGWWSSTEAAPWAVGLPSGAALVVSIWGLIEAVRPPRVRTIEVPLEGLPSEADGLCAVQVSDIHLSRMLAARSLRRLVEQVNALEPDLIVVTGDVLDAMNQAFPDRNRFLAELAQLRSRLGTYAVTGNHEISNGEHDAVAQLRRFGFKVLANEVVEPVVGLLLAGLHDISSQSALDPELRASPEDFARFLGPAVRSRPTILLYHQPLFAERFAELGVDLMLSGHTHAGQMLPYGRLSKRAYDRFEGCYRVGSLLLYVSPGVGCSGPPMRVGARREITRIILTEKESVSRS